MYISDLPKSKVSNEYMFADDNNVLNTINELIQKSILYMIYLTRRLPNILVKSMVIKISPRQVQVDALSKTGQQ